MASTPQCKGLCYSPRKVQGTLSGIGKSNAPTLPELGNGYLQQSPISASYQFLCRLALLRIQSQPP